MRHLLFLLAACLPFAAAEPKPVTWAQLPSHLKDTLVIVEMTDGSSVKGMFGPWSEDAVKVAVPGGVQELRRDDVKAIQVFREIPARRLRALRKAHHAELAKSRDLVFSHRAVSGLVFYGVTTGLRAASLPFCMIGDFFGEVDWSRPSERFQLKPAATSSSGNKVSAQPASTRPGEVIL
jgi:hypothetical protein